MRRFPIPAIGTEPGGRIGQAGQRLAPPACAVAALAVAIWALEHRFRPIWPLWTIVAMLCVGLLAAALASRIGRPMTHGSVQSVAAFAVVLLVTFWLPSLHSYWRISPLWVVALLLCLGQLAGPVIGFANARLWPRLVQLIMAAAAILTLLWELSVDRTFFYTASPAILQSVDHLPITALKIVIVLLCGGLSADHLIGRETVRRLLLPVALLVALSILAAAMVFAPHVGVRPEWPLLWAAVALALGLAADPLERVASLPAAKVLADRVDELSRTRSGVLDVQATELRRIERDLHDGAQVRLVALSMKLGRAEDRYRDDPETAALLREAREDATAAIRELRELARGIAPPVLADRGLEAAVRSLAQRSGVQVAVSATIKRRPSAAVETAAYFVVAESLTNAVKHAQGARIEIHLAERGQDLVINITDFGPGGADAAGSGLTGLRQRVEALDGFLRVRSTRVGTQVEAVMPCGR